MKRIRIILLVLLLAMLTGCNSNIKTDSGTSSTTQESSSTETTSELTTSSSSDKGDNTSDPVTEESPDDFFITFYYDENSDDYKNLCDKPDEVFDDVSFGLDKFVHVRFTTETDDVTVELLDVDFCVAEQYCHKTNTIFSTNTKSGKIYQFGVSLSNDAPHYIIKATKGNNVAYWYPIDDSDAEVTIFGALPKQGLEENSIMTPLIKSYVAFSCLKDSNDIAENKEIFWQAISYAINMQNLKTLIVDHTCYTPESWLVDAYAKAMFPNVTEYPSFPSDDLVSYDDSDKTRYKFMPNMYASDKSFTFVNVEYKQDGTAAVDYTFTPENSDAPATCKRVHLEPVQDVNGDNPFLWRITGIETIQPDEN
ncbi:MAG: hypothetical protein ACI4II_02115 [Acutalibacteraceae bacterium]